jgi:hypothetical protein
MQVSPGRSPLHENYHPLHHRLLLRWRRSSAAPAAAITACNSPAAAACNI